MILPSRNNPVLLTAAILLGTSMAQAQPTDLALALDRTESARTVRNLQILLAHHVEAGDWAAAAELFAPDATADWNGETVKGRAAIRADLQRRLGGGGAKGDLHTILALSPVVTLAPNGDHARARWHEVGLFGGAGVTDNWTGGIYENSYVRQHGQWRIAGLSYRPQFKGSYAQGWRNAVPDLKVTPYHYEAATVGAPATLTAAPGSKAPLLAPAELAARARRLADEDAVRNLQNSYGYYVDRRMWDDVVDLFAPDGSYASAEIGSYVGPAAIRAALEREGPAGLAHGDLNDHILTNLLVCVAPDGRTARARGLDFGWTGNNAGKAWWSLTLFDNLFEKAGNVWRLKAVRQYPRMRTDSRTSWDAGLQPTPAPGRAPDAAAPAEPTLIASCPAPAAAGPLDPAEARARIDAAAASVAIDNASNAFGNYIDDFEWANLSKVFTRAGLREAPGVGFYRTPERIFRMQSTRYGKLASPRTNIPIHARIQPVIHVSADGQSAHFRVRLMQFNSALASSGGVMGGIYEDQARLEDGVWRLSFVEIDHYLQTRGYADLWTNVPEGLGQRMLPNVGALRDFPPDAPLVGEVAAPYPAVGKMWFHYANPVSGRRPPLMTPKTQGVRSGSPEESGQ
ncbi:MAG: nuclear transport factor 2 family protein [Sphingomonadales bacterium]|nr:nuclear transport factor 2 family protein [Sphingomonadales bacterium]